MEKSSMDNLFKELLKESASLAAKELGEEIDINVEVEFSKEHQDRMNKLFARENRKIRARKFGAYVSRIAAVLVVVIAVSGVAVFNVDALRVRFLNMFTDTQPTNTEISFKDGNSYSNGTVTVGYMPEGFELETEKVMSNMLFLKFIKGEKYFAIDIRDSYSNASVDTEDAEVEKIDLNGSEVFYSKKESRNILTYYVDKHTIYIIGNIEKNLMIEILKNIKLN